MIVDVFDVDGPILGVTGPGFVTDFQLKIDGGASVFVAGKPLQNAGALVKEDIATRRSLRQRPCMGVVGVFVLKARCVTVRFVFCGRSRSQRCKPWRVIDIGDFDFPDF